VVYEEQLSQKDELIDNLEREVRGANAQAREFESQVHAMRRELEGLQDELIAPAAALATPAAAEVEPNVQQERMLRLEEELSHARAVAGHLRDAMLAQRATIEALTARLQWGSVPLPSPGQSATQDREPEMVDAAEREALDAQVAALQEEIARAEASRAGAEVQVQQLQAELQALREKSATQRKKSYGAEQELKARVRELEGAADAERAALSEATDGRAAADKRAAELESANQRLAAKVKDYEATIEALREERQVLQKQVGRFRRGRRLKRAGNTVGERSAAASESASEDEE